jgi:hypothetical protein
LIVPCLLMPMICPASAGVNQFSNSFSVTKIRSNPVLLLKNSLPKLLTHDNQYEILQVLIKEMAPAVLLNTPRPGPKEHHLHGQHKSSAPSP